MKIYIKPVVKLKDCHYKYYLCAGSGRGSSHGNTGDDPNGNPNWYNEGYQQNPIENPVPVPDDNEGLGSMGKRGFWDY